MPLHEQMVWQEENKPICFSMITWMEIQTLGRADKCQSTVHGMVFQMNKNAVFLFIIY